MFMNSTNTQQFSSFYQASWGHWGYTCRRKKRRERGQAGRTKFLARVIEPRKQDGP